MSTLKRFTFVTEQATSTKGMNNREAVRFHYFNPNGLLAAHKALMSEIRRLVDLGTVKSGWLLAYDADFEYNQMLKLYAKKRVRGTDLRVMQIMFQDAINRGYQALAKLGA